MKILYALFIRLLQAGITISALWNEKAKAWISGRKELFEEIDKTIKKGKPRIWMHCASAGEFEQGKPILESIKNHFPDYEVVVSFFSPSGFAAGKKYKAIDHIVYLPLDTKNNAVRFLDLIEPKLVIFIKYDYWYHHLKAIRQRKIPLLMASAIYRKESIFFKWYGGLHRTMLTFFQHIFVQDAQSKLLLEGINIHEETVAGDTRFDRVAAIAKDVTDIEKVKLFVGGQLSLICGSTWPDDEKIIYAIAKRFPQLKIIMAPHEVHTQHIDSLLKLFPGAALYSDVSAQTDSNILIINNVGMLSRLYQYATVTYIGGGFNKSGIHNTLEAAVWHKPVIFGPVYEKFKEAKELINCGAAFSINTADEMAGLLEQLLYNKEQLIKSSNAAGNYVMEHTGATQIIINYIQENRLLTTA